MTIIQQILFVFCTFCIFSGRVCIHFYWVILAFNHYFFQISLFYYRYFSLFFNSSDKAFLLMSCLLSLWNKVGDRRIRRHATEKKSSCYQESVTKFNSRGRCCCISMEGGAALVKGSSIAAICAVEFVTENGVKLFMAVIYVSPGQKSIYIKEFIQRALFKYTEEASGLF